MQLFNCIGSIHLILIPRNARPYLPSGMSITLYNVEAVHFMNDLKDLTVVFADGRVRRVPRKNYDFGMFGWPGPASRRARA